MKKIYTTLTALLLPLFLMAQGWPAQYGGVMLQGFYWDSYDDTNWTVLEQQADELSATFDLIWIPQSGNCGGTSMGYDDLYWFNNYNSSFGNEQQLRSMIQTFKQKGLKTSADVVINHRRNVSSWVDFPKETYQGQTYEMVSTDICANDDGGKTKTWATQNGFQLSTNNDTGEGWDGMRDLDHKSENVQRIVKAYLNFLKNDLGYAGFRYDMVKGYSASFTGQYNTSSSPEFSVGECWDGTTTIKNWIEGTTVNGAIQSAAFDFQFRYTIRNAANQGNWNLLSQQNDGNWPLVSNRTDAAKYFRYAVTFTENHDTEKRSNAAQDPLKKDTLAANAYMLAMPGTPCVFLTHWKAYPTELKSMVAARKLAGIHNQSSYRTLMSTAGYFCNSIDDKLAVVVGNEKAYTPEGNWVKILSGYHYAYYLAPSMETAWASLATSTYEGEQQTTLTAVSAQSGAQLVYTLDGTTPTAQSTRVASGTQITIPIGTTTLTVGLLVNGQVTGLITRTYTVKEKAPEPTIDVPSFCVVEDGEVCAFFEAPATWTNTIQCWAWDSSRNYTGGTWPGSACTKLGNASNGNAVWKWHYSGTLTTQPAQIIFSNNGAPQTADLPFQNGGYYTQDGLKENVLTGIKPAIMAQQSGEAIYNLNGQQVRMPLRRGLYIKGNKKYFVR